MMALAGCALLAPVSPTLLGAAVSAVSVTDSSVKGRVVNLPIATTPVKWVITNNKENNYVMLVSLQNVCSISAVGCKHYSGSSFITGTVWNASGESLACNANDGYCAQIVAYPKTYNYLQQMDNVYDNFPDAIGGFGKGTVILDKSWNMDAFNTTGGRVTSYNSIPYGTVTSRVNLPSHYEWQIGLDTGTGSSSSPVAEPATNSVGNLWCSAQYSNHNNFSVDTPCLGQNIASWFNPLWLRSVNSGNSMVWYISGEAIRSLSSGVTYSRLGLLPAIWLAGTVQINSGCGTMSQPYCLVGDTWCEAMICSMAKLVVTATTGSAGAGITLSGTAEAGGNGQSMTVWADACNVAGQCVRKTYNGFTSATSATPQNWTLSWAASELPAGTYNGTVWAGLAAGSDNVVAQSGTVNFTISPKVLTIEMTVIKNRAFSLSAGPVAGFDVTLGTNNGVTAGNSGGKLVLSSASGLAGSTTATFGNTKFEITVIEPPQISVSNVSFE
jgi:hypothetical protein